MTASDCPFPVSVPEREGIPSAAVEGYIRELTDTGFCFHSLLILRHGRLICETYWKPFDRHFMHRLYSVSKSFVAAAVGLLCSRGTLRLTDRVTDFFPEYAAEASPQLKRTTIRDLLLMAAPYEDGSVYHPSMENWTKTFFTAPVSHDPGQVYSYCTEGTTALCAVIRRAAGMDLPDVLRPVFDRIGFSPEAYCIEAPDGFAWGGSGMVATARDLALFAQLCCRYGNWNGEQLLPAGFLREATSPLIPNWTEGAAPDQCAGYGYQFWCTRHGGFAMRGMGGQFAICLPREDLVVVTTGYDELNVIGKEAPFTALWRHLYPALRDEPLPEDAQAHRRLEALAASLELPAVGGCVSSPLTGVAGPLEYVMDPNTSGFERVRFDFSPAGGVFRWRDREGSHSLPFGLGKNEPGTFPQEGLPGRNIGRPLGRGYRCLTSAAFFDPQTLLLHCQVCDLYLANLRLTARFDGDRVTLHMRKHAEWFLENMRGFASGTLVSPGAESAFDERSSQ